MPASEMGESMTRSGAELVQQAHEHLEDGTGHGHIFTDDKNALIAGHLFGNGLADRLTER